MFVRARAVLDAMTRVFNELRHLGKEMEKLRGQCASLGYQIDDLRDELRRRCPERPNPLKIAEEYIRTERERLLSDPEAQHNAFLAELNSPPTPDPAQSEDRGHS